MTVDWGDGSAIENPTVFPIVGASTLGATHTYADQGTYTVTVTVMDNNGGTNNDTFQVFVAPVSPTATFSNSGPVTEGSSATVSFTNQFDPSSADTTAGFHYAYDLNNDGTFDVGDGTYAGSGTNASQNVSASLLIEGPGDYTVKVPDHRQGRPVHRLHDHDPRRQRRADADQHRWRYDQRG